MPSFLRIAADKEVASKGRRFVRTENVQASDMRKKAVTSDCVLRNGNEGRLWRFGGKIRITL